MDNVKPDTINPETEKMIEESEADNEIEEKANYTFTSNDEFQEICINDLSV